MQVNFKEGTGVEPPPDRAAVAAGRRWYTSEDVEPRKPILSFWNLIETNMVMQLPDSIRSMGCQLGGPS
eukprot:SAG11_NODE_1579_length_4652_cov_5.253459_2_plen_69_part_00